MDILILLTVLQMFSLIGAYEFTCPSQAHWNLRAKSMCKTTTNYTCLFDINLQVNVYRDKCYRPRILGPGYKYVFQPNLNRAACSDNRYQPFNFETIGYSDCTYQKSLCNSLGQETYKTGDTSIDRKCVCNIEGGYTFVRNSKDQCFCNPSTEDCSCYVGINNYNTTIGQEDMKCYDDMKMTRLRNSDDRLNISRTNKITDFDNYKYNLNYVPTNEYRIEAAKWVLLLLSAYLVVWILIEVIFRRWTKNRNRDINKLNKHVQSSETEKRYFVRIMIVGKGTAGKTCLLRRLLKEDISNVTSTDGVDINVHRCKINIKDGTWTIGKDIGDDKKDRIKRALMSDGNIQIKTTEDTSDRKNMYIKSRQSLNVESNTLANKSIKVNKDSPVDMTPADSIEAIDTKNMQVDETKYKHLSNVDELSTNKKDSTTDTKVGQDENESLTLVMPKDLMSHVFSKSTGITPSNDYALCELWDFAGQKEFYATHQAFLTSSAVYLVVADMKDDISKQGLNQFSSDFQHIGEYVDFWFDSIHCHRTSDTERVRDGHFDPPILLVFTGKDKYNEADFEKRKKELNDQIDQVLGNQSKYHHLQKKFFLSNKAVSDEEFDNLRDAIFTTVGTMNNWGKAFPLRWILLEHLIEINKKIGKNFINFKEMSNLAKHPEIKILKEDDLLSFLRFQHNIGNIIFFENIRDLIILKPQWLADAFRCLVSNRLDNSRLHHRKDWTLFTREGTISESLITALFELKNGSQFSGQNNNLHKVMENLDILVKIENSSYYIMPSMMPSSTFDGVCKRFGIIDGKCKRTSWLCFKFEFLPPSFFNHLSAWFIRKYDPSKEDGEMALNRGICMFDIDASGGTKILVTMSTDTIALQVVTFSEQQVGLESTCNGIYNEVTKLFKDIKERYKVKLSFKLHFQCSDGYYFQDIFEYEKLKTVEEFLCTHHKQMHRSDHMYLPWINNEVKRIPDRVDIGNKQDDHTQKIEPNKEAFDEDQAYVKNNLPVSVTLRQQLNIKKSKNENPMITSCIKTGNTLVITDYSNKRLIICNVDGTDINHMPLSYEPRYITEINSNTVAVSCRLNNTILIINISTRSVTSTIKSGYCYGISYNDNNLYVVIDWSTIHVMDLTGKVIRTIPAPTDAFNRDITVDRDRLVCIDDRSIYCCSLDGKLMWKFKMDDVQDLTRVTTDNEGNVYVTNENTHTVIVVSDDGKHHKELLTESDGLKKPFGIYFDKKENVLLVCNERDGNAFLFDVIKKLT